MTTQSHRISNFAIGPLRRESLGALVTSLPLTLGISIVICVVYLTEYFLGINGKIIKLYSYGAFTTVAVFDFNQWWRVLTAPFLHYDFSHLAASLVLISSLGVWAELKWGRLRTLSIYLLGMFAPMLLSGVFYNTGYSKGATLFGTTYALFALLGFSLWRIFGRGSSRSMLSLRLRVLLVIAVALLTWAVWSSYFTYPSFYGHLIAYLTGVVLSLSMMPWSLKRSLKR